MLCAPPTTRFRPRLWQRQRCMANRAEFRYPMGQTQLTGFCQSRNFVCEKEDPMREVAIVSPVRTAVGRFGGGVKDIPAAEVRSIVIKAGLRRTRLGTHKNDQGILGYRHSDGEKPA